MGASPADIEDAIEVFSDYTFYSDESFLRRFDKPISYESAVNRIKEQASKGFPVPIPINQIETHQDWGRRIQGKQLLNPIIVVKAPKRRWTSKQYVVLDGQHRILTLKDEGEEDMLAYVIDLEKPVARRAATAKIIYHGSPHKRVATKMKKPTQEMLDFFKKRTKEHIDRVVKYMKMFRGFKGLDEAALMERAAAHDRDKYTNMKLVLPYIWITEYHRVNNENGSVPDWLQEQYDLAGDASGKHVSQNRHHPESHAAIEDMTDLDLVEMVSDWAAMAEELGEGSPRGWADKNVGNKWKFTIEQKKRIYEFIDHIEEQSKIKERRAAFVRVASSYSRQYEPGPLQHRRQTPTLSDGYVLLFSDDTDRNSHYGPNVWTLQTELPDVPEYVVQFAADYYDIDEDEAEELVDPPNIVSTAGAWDDPEFVYAVWDRFEDPGYRTYDGAVVLDRDAVQLEYSYDDEE